MTDIIESPARLRMGGSSLARLANTRATGVALIVAILVAWEVVARNGWVDSNSFPPVSKVLSTLVELMRDGTLPTELGASLERMFIGYFIAALLASFIGILMGYFRAVYNLLEPLAEILRPIPSPAYIPIAILFLGIDDAMKIFMVSFACFFPILLNTYSGVRSVDPVQIDTGRTFGLGAPAILWQIVAPAAAPFIFAGLRISLAISLIVVVISEMVAGNSGIGYFILDSQRAFQVKAMYAGILTLALLGYLLNWLFLLVESRVLSWHVGSRARNE